jgi:hypothetical protein
MSQSEITANSDMLNKLMGPRLAMLEATNLARRYTIDSSLIARNLERLAARIENRVIERILISRLKFALRQTGSLEATQLLISQMRGGYESGALETLPSFIPRGLSPRGSAPTPRPGANPDRSGRSAANRPVVLYVAGGGFIMPPSRKQKTMVQRLAEAVNCEVLMVAHRLAPEHPFPAAPLDFAAQYLDLLENGHRPEDVFSRGRHRGCINCPGRPAAACQQDGEHTAGRHRAVFAMVRSEPERLVLHHPLDVLAIPVPDGDSGVLCTALPAG